MNQPYYQTTIKQPVQFEGVGLHTGQIARLSLYPAPENTGIAFIDSQHKILFKAELDAVIGTEYCVTLGNRSTSVKTVEHLLSALMALSITNIFIYCDGPEIPLMDGSSWFFCYHLRAAGIELQAAPRLYAVVSKKIDISIGEAKAIIEPGPAYQIHIELHYEQEFLRQEGLSFAFNVETSAYERDIARARTYGFKKDTELYQKYGLAKGASVDNVLIYDEDRCVSTEAQRFPQEIVRHKILDVIGDLSLIGAPLIGTYHAYCPGHTLNVAMAKALIAQEAISLLTYDKIKNYSSHSKKYEPF